MTLEKLIRLARKKGEIDPVDVDAVLAANTDAVLTKAWVLGTTDLVGKRSVNFV